MTTSLLNDVLDEGLSEGDTVEVFHVMKLLDDFQVGLPGFNLRGQVFRDFLDGFIPGEEVKYLIDVSPKMSMLPNSSIKLILKSFQLEMLLKGPLLMKGIA